MGPASFFLCFGKKQNGRSHKVVRSNIPERVKLGKSGSNSLYFSSKLLVKFLGVFRKKLINFTNLNTSPKQNVLYVLCNQKEGGAQRTVLSPSRGAQQFLISLFNPLGRWKGFSFYYKHKINCLLNEALINLNLAHLSLIFKLVYWIATITFWTEKWNAGIEPWKYFLFMEKGCKELWWGGQSRQASNSSVVGIALTSSGSTLKGNSLCQVVPPQLSLSFLSLFSFSLLSPSSSPIWILSFLLYSLLQCPSPSFSLLACLSSPDVFRSLGFPDLVSWMLHLGFQECIVPALHDFQFLIFHVTGNQVRTFNRLQVWCFNLGETGKSQRYSEVLNKCLLKI